MHIWRALCVVFECAVCLRVCCFDMRVTYRMCVVQVCIVLIGLPIGVGEDSHTEQKPDDGAIVWFVI